jgi:hypothetical protein
MKIEETEDMMNRKIQYLEVIFEGTPIDDKA